MISSWEHPRRYGNSIRLNNHESYDLNFHYLHESYEPSHKNDEQEQHDQQFEHELEQQQTKSEVTKELENNNNININNKYIFTN